MMLFRAGRRDNPEDAEDRMSEKRSVCSVCGSIHETPTFVNDAARLAYASPMTMCVDGLVRCRRCYEAPSTNRRDARDIRAVA